MHTMYMYLFWQVIWDEINSGIWTLHLQKETEEKGPHSILDNPTGWVFFCFPKVTFFPQPPFLC